MSRWFRHYAGMMRDEKLVSAAIRSKQTIERVVWVWGAILESAAELDDGGRYEIDRAEMAYFLRADEADLAAIEDALCALGRTDQGAVVKWGDRQFQSDRSAERVKKYRDKRKAANLPISGSLSHFLKPLQDRDGSGCGYCGSDEHPCVDHMIPLLRGGCTLLDNLVQACKRCNSGKSGRTPDEAGYTLLKASARAALKRYTETHGNGYSNAPESESESESEKERSPIGDQKKVRGSRLPEDWRPSASAAEFAESLGLDPEAVLGEFRDYWTGVPGQKGVKLDWDATYRNRCRQKATASTGRGRDPPERLPAGVFRKDGILRCA